MPSVLLFGVSGLTGGPFLKSFRREYPDTPVTVYVRTDKFDDALRNLNASIERGTHEELERVTDLCSRHDIVINVATSSDVDLTKAILSGLEARKGILIHLSGAGNFLDGGKSGAFPKDGKIWNDANETDMRKISASMQPNGACDELVFRAAEAGRVKAYFVSPGGVYGRSKDSIGSESGGVFATWMTGNITQLGYSPFINEGTSVFQLVHVDDVVSLILLVYKKALLPKAAPDAYGHYYMALGEQLEWKTIAGAFADLLYRQKKIASPQAKQVVFEEAGFLNGLIGANLLAQNDNARSLGWEPREPGLVATLSSME